MRLFRTVIVVVAVVGLGCGGPAEDLSSEVLSRPLAGVNAVRRLHARDAHSPVTAVSWAPNRLDLFARDARGSIFIKSWLPGWIPPDGMTAIGGPAVGGEAFIGSPRSVSWGPNSLHVFALGASGNLLLKAWSGTNWVPAPASDWLSLGAPSSGLATEPAVVSWGPDRLDVFATGEDGKIYGNAWAPGWTGWISLGGGSFVGAPAAVSWAPNVLHVFARHKDGSLHFKAWDGQQWVPSVTGWVSLGKPPGAGVAGPPQVVSWGRDRLDVFVPATDHRLYMKSWLADHWVPSNTWNVIGAHSINGGLSLAGDVEVVSWAPGRLHLLARASDGSLLIKAWAVDRWVPDGAAHWVSLGMPAGGPLTDPPTVVSWAADRLDIVARAQDGNLYMKSWVTDHWVPDPGWNILAGPVGGDDVAMAPLWTGDTVLNESVLITRPDASASASASLLFPASRVISVRDLPLGVEYTEGVDWTYDATAKTLKIPSGSRTPFITSAQTPSGGSNLQENRFFHDRQLAVSYVRAASNWTGPVPSFGTALPAARARLQAAQSLRLGLYGDSITVGYNASGCGPRCAAHFASVAPFQFSWGELVRRRLNAATGAPVTLDNDVASAGWTSADGLADGGLDRLLARAPHLVVLAFGMNDGNPTAVAPATFARNIADMMARIRRSRPLCEIILVSPMLANPSTNLSSTTRQLYEAELAKLVDGPSVALVRMTSVHQALLGRKGYLDMTGNGFNHPNDYLIRWYAQQVAGLLVP
jgi:lysophospholipase L1-like esterase